MTTATTIRGLARAASPIAVALARAAVMPITTEQYQKMIAQRIVPEDSTVELLRGVMVRKDRGGPGEDAMGQSPLHGAVVALLTALAGRINNDKQHLQIQLPVVCPPDGVPEPDGAIVRGQPRDYIDRLPGPADVSCVIEAAHSSLDRDREDKLPIYAAAGIGQYVIINLNNQTLEVYSDPDAAAGRYRTMVTLGKREVAGLRPPDGGVFELEAGEVLA